MQTPSKIFKQLKIIETLSQQGNIDTAIEQTIDKIITQELENTRHSQAEFYQRLHRGELGDDVDFIEWNAFYEMKKSLDRRIDLLESSTN
jgi:hypothetical protein